MLNTRFRISFDDIFNYAVQEDKSYQFTAQVIAIADQDIAEMNIETIKRYRYIYCESDNSFVNQVGREFSASAKSYGLLGLKAAAIGVGVSLGFDGDLTASVMALGVGAAGGAAIGGVVGGLSAIYARSRDRLLKTPEEKEKVAELLQIAQSRVAFFNQKKVNNEPMQIVAHHDKNDHDEKNSVLVPR